MLIITTEAEWTMIFNPREANAASPISRNAEPASNVTASTDAQPWKHQLHRTL
jgi:hypothetical protein